MKKALLLVDLQNDFCPDGALAVNEGDRVIEVANRAIEACVAAGVPVIASQDWHPLITAVLLLMRIPRSENSVS